MPAVKKKGVLGSIAANVAFYSGMAAGFTPAGVTAGSAAALAQGAGITYGSSFWVCQSTTGGLCTAVYSTTVAGALLPFATPVALAAAGYFLMERKGAGEGGGGSKL